MSQFLRRIMALALIVMLVAPVVAQNTTPAAAQGTCGTAPAPRLTVGQQARVTVTDGTGNNLRDFANTTGTVLGVLGDGEIFNVISGPQCAENYWWWQIRRWDGSTGWTAEGVTGEYWIEPWPIVGAKLSTGPRPNLPGSLIAYATPGASEGAWLPGLLDAAGAVPSSVATTTRVDDQQIIWSPDGTRFVVSAYGDLMLMTLQPAPNYFATTAINITNTPNSTEIDPTWSPDGQRLAFTYGLGQGTLHDIYSLSLTGGIVQPLTSTPTANENSPAWSPDGSRIAFSSDRDGNYEIYVMNADGSNPFRVTVNQTQDFDPVWSPDGRQIAFMSQQADSRQDLYVVNSDGSGLIALTTDGKNYHFPVWSPDSQRIAFVGGNPAVVSMEALFSVRRDGTDRMQYTIMPGMMYGPATWSPDNNWITFAQNGEAGSAWDIFAIRSSGINLVNLTNTPGANEVYPAWQPRYTPGAVTTPPGVPTPVATAPAINPGAQDLLLIYNTSAPAFTLQNVSGKALNLTPITFSGAGVTAPASIWTEYTASPVESFKPLGCLMIWPFGIAQQPAPAECGDARQGWIENGRYVFWTQGSFTVSYNGVVVATCNTADGRCVVDLP